MSQADGPENDGSVGENVEVSSVHSAATTAPLVDLHACGICFQVRSSLSKQWKLSHTFFFFG